MHEVRNTVPTCAHDTDNDGNCGRCSSFGNCPMSVFRRCAIDAHIMTELQIHEFKRNAQKFKYVEWLGIVTGWRSPDGTVLIEQILPDINTDSRSQWE